MMPYFIKQTSAGWDTVKDDGEVLGKHKTKAQAIAQMVAVSLSEGIAPGGELKRAVDAGSYSPPEGAMKLISRLLVLILVRMVSLVLVVLRGMRGVAMQVSRG